MLARIIHGSCLLPKATADLDQSTLRAVSEDLRTVQIGRASVARNKHIGSSFDSFIVEQGLHEEVTAVALKRVIDWQIAEAMKQSEITKPDLAPKASCRLPLTC